MQALAGTATKRLRLEPQPVKRDRAMAIGAQAITVTMNALQGVADFAELAAVDVRNNTFDLMLASALARVVGVLQERLARRFSLCQPMKLRHAITFEPGQAGLQHVGENDALGL